ncbi:MAG TPA: VWA domain-containing protein [Thermoanaerobaculia bacterium]|nr:VWA domain-containing protein [Thermoanaerobaculia bacterium]
MKRTLVAAYIFVFAATSILAQDAPAAPPPPQQPQADASAGPPDPGVRKLTRRERKDRIARLKDQYRQFLEDVEPIMQASERDTFLLLETDPQREIYIREFWRRRDLAAGTTNDSFRIAYYSRLEEAKDRYKQVSSDRARMYLIHGEPLEIIKSDCTRLLQPLEIWKYPYVPRFGSSVRFLFYQPRLSNEFRLWRPIGDARHDLAELISQDAMGAALTSDEAVRETFLESAGGRGTNFISRIEWECPNGDEILRAIGAQQQNRMELMTIFEPPKVNEEDVRKILRSVVIADPNAPKLEAEFSARYPAKQGMRTDAELTVLVPRGQLAVKEVGGVSMFSLDVTGEILRNDQLWENYRYRFDFPIEIADEKLPLVMDRFLRPGDYQSRIKVIDVHSGAQAILEHDLEVPEIFDTPEQRAQKEAGTTAVSQLKGVIDSGETMLRIVPLPEELLSGRQKIETIAVGEAIKAVEFHLDGRKVAVKRQPPYTLDLDFGDVPQARKVKVLALDEEGNVLTGDDIVVNTGNDPFRVRIVSPRAGEVKGRTRVEMSVRVPEGQEVGELQLFLNETKLATLYNPPFVQTITVPETEGVGYLRAVALLKDDAAPPVEDVVMINTPAYMETVEVHLVELPTTVLVNGKPASHLTKSAFRVLDEGKPVTISKFEYVKNLPLSIGMAIDTSGSMQPRMSEAQKAGAQFFQNIMKRGDKAFLVGFDSQPQLVQKWSQKIADVHAGLAKLRAEEYTALYDAVVYSLYNFQGVKGQRALVVLTDGKDTASKFSFDQAIEYSRRAAVPVYFIALGIRTTEVDVRFKIGRLAAETGGSVYYIERAEDLRRIYDDIQAELRSQYVLGFYPPPDVKAGSKWRTVTVQVSEGKAKTIRGYYP